MRLSVLLLQLLSEDRLPYLAVPLMVGLTLLGLLVGVFWSAQVILLGGFENLESEVVQRNLERALNVTSIDLDELGTNGYDESA